MTTPDPGSPILTNGPVGGSKAPGTPVHPDGPAAARGAKNKHIQVSPVVLGAAWKDAETLLRELRSAPGGLTQAEAEARAVEAGPNEVAQEKPQGWFIRLLKIMRNPLVILLGILSAVSFATGDARAGTVMAMMVALSVGLRFLQEARADAAAAKLKAMGTLAGVPDFYVAWAGGTLWIELKAEKGSLSIAQEVFGDRVLAIGHGFETCRSVDGVLSVLKAYGVPMRAKVAA